MGTLRREASLRHRLADLFSRHPTATIERDALVVSAPASEVDHVYQALLAGAPLLVALAQVEPYRVGQRQRDVDFSKLGLVVFGLIVTAVWVAALAGSCHPPP